MAIYKKLLILPALFLICGLSQLQAQAHSQVQAQQLPQSAKTDDSAPSASSSTNEADTEVSTSTENSADNQQIYIHGTQEVALEYPFWDFFFTLGPVLYVNTDSSSAPSPVKFSAGLGFDFFTDKVIAFQPKVSVFTNYYLWDGQYARPAEVENRTALALSFLFDLNATHTWNTKTDFFELGGGISFLARYAFLANGVEKTDSGSSSDTTAGDDVKSINSWFYKDLNFLYPNLSFCYMHRFTENYFAGLETKIYIPIGALKDGRALDTTLVFFGIKVCIK